MSCNENLTFQNFGKSIVYAGLIGENDVRTISIDCSAVLSEFTAYTVTLLIQFPSDSAVYPAPCTVTNGVVEHEFTATELQNTGMGRIAIMISSTDGRIKKSANAPLMIGDVLTQPKTVPTEVENWIASISNKLIPDDGVPYDELSEGVKQLLDKADTALQEADLTPYRTAADQDTLDQEYRESIAPSLAKADTALQPDALTPYRTAADQDSLDTAYRESIAPSLAKADTALQPDALNPYRTAADQDALDTAYRDSIAPSIQKADTALQPAALDPYRTAEDQDVIDQNFADDIKILENLDHKPVAFTTTGLAEYIVYSSGETSDSSSGNTTTDYIDISDYGYIYYKQQGYSTISGTNSGMAFYDSDKTYINGLQSALGQTTSGYLNSLKMVEVPAVAKFARFTVYSNIASYGEFALYGATKIVSKIDDIDRVLDTSLVMAYASEIDSVGAVDTVASNLKAVKFFGCNDANNLIPNSGIYTVIGKNLAHLINSTVSGCTINQNSIYYNVSSSITNPRARGILDGAKAAGSTISNSTLNAAGYIKIPRGNYTISCDVRGNFSNNYGVGVMHFIAAPLSEISLPVDSLAIDVSMGSGSSTPYAARHLTKTVTIPGDDYVCNILVAKYNSATSSSMWIDNLQIERNDIETDYNPYMFVRDVQLPVTLYAVNAIRDEYDAITGDVTHRIGVIASYSGEEITTDYISSTGDLTEGATVWYVLPEPYTETVKSYDFRVRSSGFLIYHTSGTGTSGEIYVEYARNISRLVSDYVPAADAIENLTGSSGDGMIATKNISADLYFVVDGKLYKSTAAIAEGETIMPGTNCTETDIVAALNALNSAIS